MSEHDKRMAEVREKYGRTIHEILSKEKLYDRYEILGAIEMLVFSKLHQKLTTSKSERMVFGFAWLLREVQNGGFDQYFLNSAGDYWEDVLYGLEAISDKDGLAAFKKVLSIFPNSTPSQERSERHDQISRLKGLIEVTEEEFSEAVKNAQQIAPDSESGEEGLKSFTFIELDLDKRTEDNEYERVENHWKTMDKEYYSRPYPDSKLVYEYVKSHAGDFDLEKA